MEAKSVLRYARITPRKMRLLADMVRGKPLPQAVAALQNTQKRGAPILEKLVMSAAANASDRHGSDPDALYIKTIFVDGGPIIKRFITRSHGMASPLLKRTSHVTVVVDDER